jgi:glycosidase
MVTKTIRYYLLLIFILLSFSFCKKENNNDPEVKKTDSTANVPFANVPSISEMVLYEVNMRAFSESGDFAGVVLRLDSICALGVNVLWLMPIYPVGQINSAGQLGSPYSVQNYTEVNPEFGSLADFKNLVQQAHKRNMAVIIDWVANHTAWDNPWIDNTDWYTQDKDGNIISPTGTNWKDVADLNYSNIDMQNEMIKSMKYWITNTNIDGFRCDAADYVPFEFWKRAIDSLKVIPEHKLVLLAEGSRIDHYTAGFQMTYAWDFYNKMIDIFSKNGKASGIFAVNSLEYANIPSGNQKLRFITNHDEYAWTNSPVNIFGSKDASLSAFVITAFMSNVPLIYDGQEIGYSEKISFFTKNPLNWSLDFGFQNKYRKVMNTRKTIDIANYTNLVTYNDNDIVAFKRSNDKGQFLVIVNVRNKEVNYTIPSELNSSEWKDAFGEVAIQLNGQLLLKPYEYKVLTSNN